MKPRHVAGTAILLGWVVVVGMHIGREYFRTEADRLALGARGLAPVSYWYIIRVNDDPIGIGQSRLDTLPDGFDFYDEVVLDVPALGALHRSIVRTRQQFTPALALRAFQFSLDSDIGVFQVAGTLEGDTMLALELRAGAEPERSRLPVEPGLLLDAGLPLRLAAAGELQVGTERLVRVFDPAAMAERDMSLQVTGMDVLLVTDSVHFEDGRWVAAVLDTVPSWRVEQQYGGVSVVMWVDEDGMVVRAESPLGFRIERVAYQLARQEWEAERDPDALLGYGTLIEGTAIASNVRLDDLATRPELRVVLAGADITGFDLAGGRQTLHGDTLLVRQEPAALLVANYALPYAGAGAPAEELATTALIQASDPRVQAVAREIANGERDPARVARLLNDWVYEHLEKRITPAVPSALQVLEARQGDCNEHTVLYVALARALGLPARTAVGLVHLRGTFYYHAWPEVWLDGWVAVDPTLGQYPADASHLRFLVGGLARQVELIRLIGRLRLEVL